MTIDFLIGAVRASQDLHPLVKTELEEVLCRMGPEKPQIRNATAWCAKCGNHLKQIGLNVRDNFCGQCGKAVDWN